MKILAVKEFKFCCAHRLYKHESKCRNLHGHNYKLRIYAEGDKKDSVGRVIDFAVLKDRVGGWIDSNWDHATLYGSEDKEMRGMLNVYPNHKQYMMPENPTAESMAEYILTHVCPEAFNGCGVVVNKVQLWETDSSFVEVSRGSKD